MERSILIYQSENGTSPFLSWLNGLRDVRTRAIIRARIERIKLGNFSDCKSLSGGLFELRIAYGAGYRIYFAQFEREIVLFCAGHKGTQKRDIVKATKFYKEYYASKKLSG